MKPVDVVSQILVHQNWCLEHAETHLIFECSFHKRAREKFFDDFSWNNPISINLFRIEKKTLFSFQWHRFIYLFVSNSLFYLWSIPKKTVWDAVICSLENLDNLRRQWNVCKSSIYRHFTRGKISFTFTYRILNVSGIVFAQVLDILFYVYDHKF